MLTNDHLPKIVSMLALLSYGALLAGQEWRFRQASVRDVPVLVDSMVAPAREPPNVQAVATVLGLVPQGSQVPSSEPITLQASFVADQGLSRALLVHAGGSRIYQLGERLPGGSVLRRVEAGHVTLWRNGREERLALQQPAKPLLRQLSLDDSHHAALHSSQYLRPVAGQPE
ncbi:type II secretion system protein N [Pseudomonas sp. H2_D02]